MPEALANVFSCKFCEVFKNTFFYRTPPVAASEYARKKEPPLRALLCISNLLL